MGYVDKEGKFAINPQFDWAGSFNDGYAIARAGNKMGVIDETGKYVVSPQYNSLSRETRQAEDGVLGFTGRLLASSELNRWGVLKSNGEVLIEPQFDSIGCAIGAMDR
jgi:hypothetical protein